MKYVTNRGPGTVYIGTEEEYKAGIKKISLLSGESAYIRDDLVVWSQSGKANVLVADQRGKTEILIPVPTGATAAVRRMLLVPSTTTPTSASPHPTGIV